MRIIYLLSLLIVLLSIEGCKKESAPSIKNFTIGGLLSLTGNWSTLGIASQEAMNLAIKDINDYMGLTGSMCRFSIEIYDTKLDTLKALAAIKDAKSKNIHALVGPQSSAEVGAIRSFANDNNILVISQGSTAGSLAIADDAIFRLCPGDVVEGEAIAHSMYQLGIHSLITLARDDLGNRGLQHSVGLSFPGLGGTIDAITPYSTSTTDFSTILATLKSKIVRLKTEVGAANVGVYLASFDECVSLFEQASLDPVFSSVRWFGGDGVVFSDALISNATSSLFASTTQFFAPNFGLPQQVNPTLASIASAIKSKTGLDADAYCLSAYDAMWVIAKAEAAFADNRIDFNSLKAVFLSEADRYYGITGPVVLNAAGDRAIGSFDYWGIVLDNGSYKWKLVGKSL
jgi:branched-chain amino acid transport system substrate-binding protein